MQTYLLAGFILFPLSNNLMDLGGLCGSIIVRNYYQPCYQCSRIYNLKVEFPIEGFVCS